ncbi:MAG: acetyl-CoA carboxylase biotin carboxyl carrier protein [Xanthobacteraceae bacterium]
MPKSPTIDHAVIRELARLLEETGLTEIAIEQNGVAVRVARYTGSNVARARGTELPVADSSVAATVPPLDPARHPGVVASPMVGTAYRRPKPEAPPYVDVGSEVKAGETLLIIEAMKTMNQIPAPRSGTVIQILIEDGHPVEYGQPLMIIE